MTLNLNADDLEFATHFLRQTVMVTEKAERGHEAGYLHHALNSWLTLKL